jgi:hypothetical protein
VRNNFTSLVGRSLCFDYTREICRDSCMEHSDAGACALPGWDSMICEAAFALWLVTLYRGITD